ncbi:MAG: ABC transporter permease subunit [Planctomycetes bacterium]|nr:ABC transporter permease subunit [Planctomycetota bacterium]
MIEDAMIIAGDAYRDATKRKGVVYFLLGIAILQVGVFSLYEEISLGVADKLVKDAAVGMLSLVGILSGLTVIFQVPRELRERTAMTLFAKPLGREAYLLGKMIGVSGLALRNMIVVALGSLFILNTQGQLGDSSFVRSFFESGLLSFVGVIDIVAIALLLSIFLSEGVSIIVTAVIFVFGNALYMLANSSAGVASVATIAKYILPNFYLLDIKTEAVAELSYSPEYIGLSSAYGLSYAVMIMALSVIIFKKRDL